MVRQVVLVVLERAVLPPVLPVDWGEMHRLLTTHVVVVVAQQEKMVLDYLA